MTPDDIQRIREALTKQCYHIIGTSFVGVTPAVIDAFHETLDEVERLQKVVDAVDEQVVDCINNCNEWYAGNLSAHIRGVLTTHG